MIFLVGMPAAGKTYWASKLADQYSYQMIDLDNYIEQQRGKNIQQIFSDNGEAYFRELETQAIKALTDIGNNKNTVIACGGGTPVYNDNMKHMLDNGCVVYLKTPIDELYKRIKVEPDKRPLLVDGNLKDKLIQLYNHREQCYTQAHYTIETDKITIKDFDKIIQLCTERQ